MMGEGHLGHCDNKLIVFDSQRSKSQQTCHLGLWKDKLWLTDWESPLRSGAEGQRSPASLGILHESNMKSTETGHPQVLKDDPIVRKSILAEQRAVAGTQHKKECSQPLEELDGNSGGLLGFHKVI